MATSHDIPALSGPSVVSPHKRGASSRSALSLSAILPILLLTAAWVFLAPTPIGGQASYVIINGNSMEPGYHRGDLVILRTAESYHVGDIVAYRGPRIGSVIYRIVEQNDDQFVLQGDNNSRLDSYNPTYSEVIGKSFVHIPSIGKYFKWMRSPMGLVVMVVVVGGIGLMSFETAREEDKQPYQEARGTRWRRALAAMHKQGDGSPGGGSPSGDSPSGDSLTGDGSRSGRVAAPGQNAQGVVHLLVVAMLLSLLLGGFAFTRSASSTVSEDLAY